MLINKLLFVGLTGLIVGCSSNSATTAQIDTNKLDSQQQKCDGRIIYRTADPSVKGNSDLMFSNKNCGSYYQSFHRVKRTSQLRIQESEQRQGKRMMRDNERIKRNQ